MADVLYYVFAFQLKLSDPSLIGFDNYLKTYDNYIVCLIFWNGMGSIIYLLDRTVWNKLFDS